MDKNFSKKYGGSGDKEDTPGQIKRKQINVTVLQSYPRGGLKQKLFLGGVSGRA